MPRPARVGFTSFLSALVFDEGRADVRRGQFDSLILIKMKGDGESEIMKRNRVLCQSKGNGAKREKKTRILPRIIWF